MLKVALDGGFCDLTKFGGWRWSNCQARGDNKGELMLVVRILKTLSRMDVILEQV